MKISKENTDKYDRIFRENAFAKAYKAKNEAREFVRNNSKGRALKSKSKIVGNVYE